MEVSIDFMWKTVFRLVEHNFSPLGGEDECVKGVVVPLGMPEDRLHQETSEHLVLRIYFGGFSHLVNMK